MSAAATSSTRWESRAIEALETVLRQAFGCTLETTTLTEPWPVLHGDELEARMTLVAGGVSVDARLVMPTKLAAVLLTRMLNRADPSLVNPGEAADFAGELCNLVSGRFCALVVEDGPELVMGVPRVVVGATDLAENPRCRVWRCDGFWIAFGIGESRSP